MRNDREKVQRARARRSSSGGRALVTGHVHSPIIIFRRDDNALAKFITILSYYIHRKFKWINILTRSKNFNNNSSPNDELIRRILFKILFPNENKILISGWFFYIWKLAQNSVNNIVTWRTVFVVQSAIEANSLWASCTQQPMRSCH